MLQKYNYYANRITDKYKNCFISSDTEIMNLAFWIKSYQSLKNSEYDDPKLPQNPNTFRFSLTFITILQESNKKSVGEDEIPISLIKKGANIICSLLAHIINLSFCTSTYRETLKTSYI